MNAEHHIAAYMAGGIDRKEWLRHLLCEPSHVVAQVVLQLSNQWLGNNDLILELLGQLYPPAPASTTTAPVQGVACLPVAILDIVQLRAKLNSSAPPLHSYGEWWKVTRVFNSRIHGLQWCVRSLSKREKGIVNDIHELFICKVNDPNYEIVNVCPSSQAFDPKNYT